MDNNQFGNNPYEYNNMQKQTPIRDWYVYIVLGAQIWMLILSVFLYITIYRIMQYNAIYGNIPADLKLMGFLSGISGLSALLNIAGIVFIVLDIVQIYKNNYPITGLILFAIFLRPAYYIWRCHILRKKMTPAIIYTVLYYVSTIVVSVWAFASLYGFIITTMLS